MKRLLGVLAGLAALVAVMAVSAAATPGAPDITLTATPAAITTSGTVTLSGVYTPAEGASAVGEYVYLAQYDDEAGSWTTTIYDREAQTTDGGVYSATLSGLPVGTYWYRAEMENVDAVSPMVEVTVTAEPVTPEPVPVTPAIPSDEAASSYLCWNQTMVDPVEYIDKVADTMWLSGNYFEPQAVLGNVEGGTNIGAYHLVCNMAGTLKETDQSVGGSGEVYDAQVTALMHAQHPGGNDLNIYHIWK